MKKTIIYILVFAVLGVGIAMKLINNKKENQSKVDVVSTGDAKIPVKVFKVKSEVIDIDFSVNGKLAANQDLVVISEVNGKVLSLSVKEGDKVTKGQVLARVESVYSGLDEQIASDALAKLKNDQTRLTAALKSGGVTQAQVDEINLAVKNAEIQLNQARKRVADAVIKAPISGVINTRFVEIGSFVGSGSQLFNIVDISSLKLKVAANERQVIQLGVGHKVAIKIPVFQDENFTGKISFIAPKADNSLNYPIEIVLDNSSAKSKLKAGMYASASFEFGEQKPIIAIPRSSFLGGVNSGQIYVIEKEGFAKAKKIDAGAVFGDMVEVLGGLNEGDIVIISGQINLVDGSVIEVIE
ncbi:MAG: efflux RND transporter periplasmic adaptor subunit [Crocinitomicaceae bacterium]|nr:efflux RND transporter periplasmic adaptor subunit [Crocinitomicaceae bacterium]